jgi:hypothetical protein
MASQPCSGARWRAFASWRRRELLLASAKLYEARRDPDHKPPYEINPEKLEDARS